MRLALLTINAGKGGVINVVHQLCRCMRERYGYEVDLVCDYGSELDRFQAIGARHIHVPMNRGLRDFYVARKRIRRYFRFEKPDIVHSHSRWPSMIAIAAGRRPDVSTVHMDRLTHHGTRLDRGILRRLFSGWGRIVTALDETTRDYLMREAGLRAERIVVVPNGVDPTQLYPDLEVRHRFREHWGLDADDFVIGFVAAMMDWKNPEACIRAVAEAVRVLHKPVKLLMIGDGPRLKYCQQLATQLGIKHLCVFTGWLSEPQPVYQSIDLFLLPSRQEGFGLCCVEAMLCEVPVIRTSCGGCDQQIIEGETGWSVPVDDQQKLTDRVIEAIHQPDRLKQMGAAARKHALNHFTEQKFIERMKSIYDTAVDG